MPGSVKVELDIFSGNPNPIWVLSDSDSAHFLDLLESLTPMPAGVISNNLGYRGFVVDVAGRYPVRVQNGTVEITEGDDRPYRADLGRSLERWLLETGKSVIASDIYELVDEELRR